MVKPLIIVAVAFFCVIGSSIAYDVGYGKAWGDTETHGLHFHISTDKFGLPLVSREWMIKFPNVSINSNAIRPMLPKWNRFRFQDFNNDTFHSNNNYIVRSIEFLDTRTDTCDIPVTEILGGGIDERFLTFRAASDIGCGLHSNVHILAEKTRMTYRETIEN